MLSSSLRLLETSPDEFENIYATFYSSILEEKRLYLYNVLNTYIPQRLWNFYSYRLS